MELRHRKLTTALVILVLTSLTMWPLVSASDIRIPYTFVASPDGTIPSNKLMNVGNLSDAGLSSYNQTWSPFFANNTDLKGTTITPFVPPLVVRDTATSLSALQRIRFSTQQIVSGSSISLWRMPLSAVPSDATINLQIWRNDASSNNVSSMSSSGPVFADPSSVEKIVDWTGSNLRTLESSWFVRTFNVALLPDMANATTTDLSASVNDTYVANGFPTTNYEGVIEMLVAQNGAPEIGRVYVNWNTLALPPDAYILNATLTLHEFEGAVNGTPQPIGAYYPSGSWSSGSITWNNQPGIAEGPSSMTAPTCNASLFVGCGSAEAVSFNVTREVQLDTTSQTNHGIRLAYVNESTPAGDFAWFRTREWLVNPGQRPTLTVRWAPSLVSYAFTYVKVFAPIFPNKDYYVFWNVVRGSPHPYGVLFTPNDLNGDGAYASWVKKDSAPTQYVPVDLDQSVVFIKGMAEGIGGISTNTTHYNLTQWQGCAPACQARMYYNLSTNTVIHNVNPSFTYINAVLPVVSTNPGTGVNDVLVDALLYDSLGNTHLFSLGYQKYNKTMNAVVVSYNLSSAAAGIGWVGHTVLRIDFVFFELTGWDWYYVSATTATVAGTRAEVAIDFSTQGPNPAVSNEVWVKAEGFGLYGYFSLDPFYFTNTQLSIVLIPVNSPDSDFGIWQLYQSLQSTLHPKPGPPDPTCNNYTQAVAFAAVGAMKNPVTGGINLLVTHTQALADCVVKGFQYIFGSIVTGLVNFFAPLADFLYNVGLWIWNAIVLIIQALQWFGFWTLKFLNVFLISVVFALVVIAPNYVGKGLYEWVKSGYNPSALKEVMDDGWNRTYSILYLLIMFVTLAIAVIGAVSPL